MNVTIQDISAAREHRAVRQRELLDRCGGTLISFTMNIAGPEKDSALIREGMRIGERLLEERLKAEKIAVLLREKEQAFTGGTCYYLVDADPARVKRITVDIEDESPAGRLYDMDVLAKDGKKTGRAELGLPDRQCLICGKRAQICARSRAHSLEELRQKTADLLRDATAKDRAVTIASSACEAILDEVLTSPKPGLVDRFNNGSHRDMDTFTFASSTAALYPYFYTCALTGAKTADESTKVTFEKIRKEGKLAEERMLQATGGVNTHRGAIFSMGILCAAAGRLSRADWSADRLRKECADMAAGIVCRDFGKAEERLHPLTYGERLYCECGVTGVRGEAEAGFPLVFETGYPRLLEGLAVGLSLNDAGCAALLAIMAGNTDTNVIHRSSMESLRGLQERIKALLKDNPYPAREELEKLDAEVTCRNISPGGSADLLAMCYMVRLLEIAGEPDVE